MRKGARLAYQARPLPCPASSFVRIRLSWRARTPPAIDLRLRPDWIINAPDGQ